MLHISYNLAAYHLNRCCITPFAIRLHNVSGFAISVGSVGKDVRESIISKDNTLLSSTVDALLSLSMFFLTLVAWIY